MDPLGPMADYCASEGIWDAHKWLFQPYEAGCLLVKDLGTLEKAFGVHHDVLQDTIWGADHPNFSDRGLQLSRSFRALKVWMSIQTFGMAAFRRAVANGMELAARAEDYVRASPVLEVVNAASLGIVRFRVNPEDADLPDATLEELNRKVLAQIFWDDTAWNCSRRSRRSSVLAGGPCATGAASSDRAAASFHRRASVRSWASSGCPA